MSLVDPYHDRVFRNGRLYGVNYNEMTNQPTYTDISPFGGGRKAGEGIGLEPDVVVYMGRAAQGMPQDKGMDQRIAEGFLKAIGQVFAQPQTMEYRPERDGPLDIRPIGPYNPDTDEGKADTLEIRVKPKQMTPGEVRDFFGGMDPGIGLDLGPYGRIVADQKRRVDSGWTPGFGDMNEYGLPRDMSPEDQAEVMKRYPL